MNSFMLPLEIWLIIFKDTDKDTFNTIMSILYDLNYRFAHSLKAIVCRDLVKYNKKIMLMIKLVNNYIYFNKRGSYLQFRYDYSLDIKYTPSIICHDVKNAEMYRNYIIENWSKIFNNDEKRKRMFMNQTRVIQNSYGDCENNDYILSDNNEISVEDVVKYTIYYG